MIYRPSHIGAFEFAGLAAHRAEQLRRGCIPRVEGGHKFVVTAQLEVIAGKVARAVQGTGQNLPDALGSFQAPAVLHSEAHGEHRAAPTAVSAPVEVAEMERTW
jgi:hypothetical protein